MSIGSSTADQRESTAHRIGVSPRAERVLEIVSGAVVLLLSAGWLWAIGNASTLSAATPGHVGVAGLGARLTAGDAPNAAFVTDAALTALAERALAKQRGISGKLEAVIQPSAAPLAADSLPEGGRIEYSQGGEVATEPKGVGIWNVLLALGNAIRPVAHLNVITMLPFSAKHGGKIGLYYVGNWPSEHGPVGPKKAPPGAYGNPAGFIEVTAANADTHVSEHFTLRDFLTHDQPNKWPKYIVLQPKLVDKLELVLSDLQSRGVNVSGVRVMSGFRTPQYNEGGGNTAGRANLSRHMYGDASDIYIDSDGDGQMDDLNHDGKISIADSKVIEAAVDRVEAAHPELVGGAGVYTAAPGHGPFIHIDTRGYRARWSGTSGG
jgi:uncharacterized protein YcbK (DUF882 family)